MALSSKIALITGGAKRIGAAIAKDLASHGWKVIVHYHTSEVEAHNLKQEIVSSGGVSEIIRADLSDQHETDTLISKSASLFGPIDCLINNASQFEYDDIKTVNWHSLEKHIKPNLCAPIMLSHAFVKALGPRQGTIINLLDQKVINLNPDFLSYTISKVGLLALTEMLALALLGKVQVCGVAPGITMISGKQTEKGFAKAWKATPLGLSSTPPEIAAAIRFILETPSMTGQILYLDGGERFANRTRDVAFEIRD